MHASRHEQHLSENKKSRLKKGGISLFSSLVVGKIVGKAKWWRNIGNNSEAKEDLKIKNSLKS